MQKSPVRKIKSPYFVHEKALCESRNVGEGTRIWAFSHVMEKVVIGKNCNIGEHVFIENGVCVGDGCTIKNGVAIWECVTLESDVFVGPYVVFTNDLRPRAFLKIGKSHFRPTLVKRGCTLGANSTLVAGITLGEYSMVGASTTVLNDVQEHSLVVGNPARIIGRVCFCGEKLDKKDFCVSCHSFLSANSGKIVTERLGACVD